MNSIPRLRSGQEEVSGMSLREKAQLISLLAPFLEEVCKTATIYVIHHQSDLVTPEIMKKAMKYHFIHPDGISHKIRQSVEEWIQKLNEFHCDEELDDTEEVDQLEEENYNNEVEPLSQFSTQALQTHYEGILEALEAHHRDNNNNNNNQSEYKVAAHAIVQNVLGNVNIVEDLVTEVEEDNECGDDNGSDNDSDNESGDCRCVLCTDMDRIEQEWNSWEPTEPWQQLLASSFNKVLNK